MLDQKKNFTKFISTTSLHGVHNLEDETKHSFKVLWSILIIMSFGLCVWQVQDRIQAYLEYPITRKVDIIHAKKLPFPAVTICASHRYNNAISDIDRKYLLLQVIKLNRVISNTSINKEEKELEDELDLFYNGTIDIQEIMIRTGFALDNSTLKDCTIAGKVCQHEDFDFYYNKWYESCWTFNGLNSSKFQTSVPVDFLYGLRLVIDIKQDEYSSTVKFGLPKFLFSIHSRNERLLKMENTFGPGLSTFAAITYQKDNFVSRSTSECIKDNPNYSMINCLNECQSRLYSELCGCRQQPFTDSAGIIPPCELSNSIVCSDFTNEEYEDIMDDDCEHCSLSCIEESYKPQISYGQIENDIDYLNEISNKYQEDPSYIRKNFLFLNVYYKSSTFTETTEVLAIPISSLISDIGGQLGIFLGMSVLTATEILQYLAKSIFLIFKNIYAAKSKNHMVVTYVK